MQKITILTYIIHQVLVVVAKNFSERYFFKKMNVSHVDARVLTQ